MFNLLTGLNSDYILPYKSFGDKRKILSKFPNHLRLEYVRYFKKLPIEKRQTTIDWYFRYLFGFENLPPLLENDSFIPMKWGNLYCYIKVWALDYCDQNNYFKR